LTVFTLTLIIGCSQPDQTDDEMCDTAVADPASPDSATASSVGEVEAKAPVSAAPIDSGQITRLHPSPKQELTASKSSDPVPVHEPRFDTDEPEKYKKRKTDQQESSGVMSYARHAHAAAPERASDEGPRVDDTRRVKAA
jgi:hypothetical protein